MNDRMEHINLCICCFQCCLSCLLSISPLKHAPTFSCSSFDTKRPTGSFRSPIRTFFPFSDIFFRADYCERNVLSLNEADVGGIYVYVCITRDRWRMHSRVFNSGRKWELSRCCPERKVSPAANMLTAVFLSTLLMLWVFGGAEASDLRVSGKSIHSDRSLSDNDGRHSVRKQLQSYKVRAGHRFVSLGFRSQLKILSVIS